MVKIPDRRDIGRRSRQKTLKKVTDKKRENPNVYFTTSDKSRFLAMDYDYKRGQLPGSKMDLYLDLKKKFEEDK